LDKNLVTIRGSFRGIAGDFLKNILILTFTIFVYVICSDIKGQYYTEYNIESFWKFVTELQHPDVMAIISLIFISYAVLLWVSLRSAFKIIVLLYETLKTTVIDFNNGKIITTSYSFPFSKEVDENKFNEIININITQDLLQRLFNTGDVTIEYLTYSKVDSQLRNLEVTYVVKPFAIKPEMI
jgi:hypothetical protein